MELPVSGNEIIHIEQFAESASKEIARWLEENGKQVIDGLNQRIFWLFEHEEFVKENVPPHILTFQASGKNLPVFTRMQVRKGARKLTPLLMITALSKYGFSVTYHQLFFGCGFPTKLSGQAAAFVHYFNAALPSDRQEILEILKLYRKEITYIPKIIQNRIKELAEARGCFPKKVVPAAQYFRTPRQIYPSFLESELPTDIDNVPSDIPHWHSNLPPIFCVLSTSMLCQVSCDYLLQQDYSPLAVHEDGTALTEQEREVLSHFLMATTEGRAKAFRYFF